MRKFIPFLVLLSLLFLVSCADSNTASTATPSSNDEVAIQTTTTAPADDMEYAESTTSNLQDDSDDVPTEGLVDMTGFTPVDEVHWIRDRFPDAIKIATCPVTLLIYVDGVLAEDQVRDYAGRNQHISQPQTDERGHIPLDSDHPFWVLHGEGANLTVDPVTGAIWNHDLQVTHPRGDDVFTTHTPADPNEEIREPVWNAPVANFHASTMRVGEYPEEWYERHFRITPLSFHRAMIERNPNLRSQTTIWQLEAVDFLGIHGSPRSMVWNNGIVTVLLQRLSNPEPGVWGRMSVTAWFTDERNPETGALSFDHIQIFYTDDMNSVWRLFEGGSEFGVEFARKLWDALALLDQAASYADIYAAQDAMR